MPKGLMVLEWNERSGIEILTQYPLDADLKVSDKTFLHIFNMHEYTGEPGFAGLNTEIVNFASFFSGRPLGRYCVVILTLLENPEDFEDSLREIGEEIFDNTEDDKFIKLIPQLYKKLIPRPIHDEEASN